jgi:hypothetical protein
MAKSGSQFRNRVFLHTLCYHGPKNPASNVTDVGLDMREGRAYFEIPVKIGTDATTALAAINSGAVILPDTQVPQGCRCYVTDVQFCFNGTAFATATDIRISDTNGTPVDFATVAIANTSSYQRLGGANVTAGAGIATGGTLSKGLQIRKTGSNATGGHAFTVVVRGFFAP